MPSIDISPASIAMTGGSVALTPVYMIASPAVLSMTGGSFDLGPDLDSGLTGRNIRLDRLLRGVPIAGPDGASFQFQGLWQKTVEAIEDAFLDQQSQIDAIQLALSQAQAALALGNEAKQEAMAVQSTIDLANSYTDPIDGLLTATSAGVVTVSAHNRVYGSTTVSVNSGTVTGQAPGTFVRIYYVDAARAGGAVTYQATTGEVTQTGDTHVIGGVTIPAVGSPPSEGIGTTPPGYVRDGLFEV